LLTCYPDSLLRAGGGTADAHGSGPCVRKDVRVQIPPRPRGGPCCSLPFGHLHRGPRFFPGARAPGPPTAPAYGGLATGPGRALRLRFMGGRFRTIDCPEPSTHEVGWVGRGLCGGGGWRGGRGAARMCCGAAVTGVEASADWSVGGGAAGHGCALRITPAARPRRGWVVALHSPSSVSATQPAAVLTWQQGPSYLGAQAQGPDLLLCCHQGKNGCEIRCVHSVSHAHSEVSALIQSGTCARQQLSRRCLARIPRRQGTTITGQWACRASHPGTEPAT
jgi:hypothetical protein